MNKKQYIDITGQRFGKLVVVKYTKTVEKRPHWECKCDCGNNKEVRGKELKSGGVQSCGCMRTQYNMPLQHNLVGKKYSFLTVMSREIDERPGVRYRCKCDCGNECVVNSGKIISGHTKSCGCLHSSVIKGIAIKRNKELRGSLHPRWRHDLTDEERRVRFDSRLASDVKKVRWRNKVFKRDVYTCQRCGDNGGHNLNAHHIYSWEKYKSLRYITRNGVTLCVPCHTIFHKKYGYGENTRKQLTSWMKAPNMSK